MLENAGRQPKHFDGGRHGNTGRIHCNRLRDERNRIDGVFKRGVRGFGGSRMPRRKEVFHAEHLRRQNAIDGGEAEFALAMNKVGNMR